MATDAEGDIEGDSIFGSGCFWQAASNINGIAHSSIVAFLDFMLASLSVDLGGNYIYLRKPRAKSEAIALKRVAEKTIFGCPGCKKYAKL